MEQRLSGDIKPRKNIKQELADIHEWIKADRYDMNDFWEICPVDKNTILNGKRLKDHETIWRHVGFVWHFMRSKHKSKTGEYFNVNHSSVIHGINRITDSYIWKDQYSILYINSINKIKKFIIWSHSCKLDCQQSNEFISLLLMENKLKEI